VATEAKSNVVSVGDGVAVARLMHSQERQGQQIGDLLVRVPRAIVGA